MLALVTITRTARLESTAVTNLPGGKRRSSCGVGITVVRAGYLNSEHDIMHIDNKSVRQMAHVVNHVNARALFFSCTNLRTFDVIEALEAQLDKPVLSVNQVTMWAALKTAGLPLPIVAQRLFAHSSVLAKTW